MGLSTRSLSVAAAWVPEAERDCASQQMRSANVPRGSKAEVAAIWSDVRFSPDSGIAQHRVYVRLVPLGDIERIFTGASFSLDIGQSSSAVRKDNQGALQRLR